MKVTLNSEMMLDPSLPATRYQANLTFIKPKNKQNIPVSVEISRIIALFFCIIKQIKEINQSNLI